MVCQQTSQRSKRSLVSVPLVLRVVLGCIFIYSALWKIQNPREFLQVIVQYQLIPGTAAGYTAAIIPWIELICGFLLLSNILVSHSLYLLLVGLCVFTGAQLSVLYKGLLVDCGCFPLFGFAPKVGFLTILRNVILIAACVGAFGRGKASANPLNPLFDLKHRLLLVCGTFLCVTGLVFVLTFNRDTVFAYPDYARSYSPKLMRNAVSEHKATVLIFVSGKCDYCHSLFDGPLRSKHLVTKMEGVRCLIVNKSVAPHSLIKAYNVRIYPSLVFIDQSGVVRSELVGYHKDNDIIRSLDALGRMNVKYARSRP